MDGGGGASSASSPAAGTAEASSASASASSASSAAASAAAASSSSSSSPTPLGRAGGPAATAPDPRSGRQKRKRYLEMIRGSADQQNLCPRVARGETCPFFAGEDAGVTETTTTQEKAVRGAEPEPARESNADAEEEKADGARGEEGDAGVPRARPGVCRRSHDVLAYLRTKAADAGPSCALFDLYGYCRFGLLCRFHLAHTDFHRDEVGAVVGALQRVKAPCTTTSPPSDGVSGPAGELNTVDTLFRMSLSHSQRSFPRTLPAIRRWAEERNARNAGKPGYRPIPVPECADAGADADAAGDLAAGASAPREKRSLDLRGKVMISSLTTVGNLPFRRIVKEYGADVTCGEMALAPNLMAGQTSEWSLLKRHVSEDVFGVQVTGKHADQMAQLAELLGSADSELTIDFVELNAGCPIDIICNRGMGAALLDHTAALKDIGVCMSSVLDVPLLLKCRVGTRKGTLHNLVPSIASSGFAGFTIHGRTRRQRYQNLGDWAYIDRCAELTSLPVVGNGDIFSFEDWEQHVVGGRVTAGMLARGVLIKPWLPTEIKEHRHWDISSRERLDIVERFVHYGLDHWGSDQQGVRTTRRFLLEWLSFLWRYVPVGLTEVMPPRLAAQGKPFVPRDDLEKLLASNRPDDWIEISKMMLGPVAAGFRFVPKHRASG